MDGSTFDKLTRYLAADLTRRKTVRAAQAGLVTLVGGVVANGALGKRKRNHSSREKKDNKRNKDETTRSNNRDKSESKRDANEDLKKHPRGNADWTIDGLRP